jgi:hypothetical protein
VTEGVDQDSHAADLAGSEVIAEDYLDVTDQRILGANHVREALLSDEEKEAVGLVAGLGFEYVSHDKVNLTFRRLRGSRSRLPSSSRRSFPRAYVRMLLAQLGEKVEEHPAVTGLMVPSRGYVEFTCSRLEPTVAKRAFRLDSDELDCLHKDPAYALPSLPHRWPDEEGGESVNRVHLSGRDGEPCVEMSNASPLAMLLHGHTSESSRARLSGLRLPFLATLKITCDPDPDRARIGRRGEETARSLIYELNVRNGVLVELDAPPAGPDMTVGRRPPEVPPRIRYPRTKVKPDVAILFGFASQTASDPPRAFLSYYQALEYFIPTAIRQSAIKKIRRELRDPSFDEASDASLLRIVKAAEGSIAAAEPNQLRIVVNEYVRASRLEEFFERDWGGYFTHRGPIKGVPHINMKNTDPILPYQVADRVYQIRNRIVHAKDDPRFGQAGVLLPQSSESNALTPDVLLVRLLATEAISVG